MGPVKRDKKNGKMEDHFRKSPAIWLDFSVKIEARSHHIGSRGLNRFFVLKIYPVPTIFHCKCTVASARLLVYLIK